jgi:hypothetical protein
MGRNIALLILIGAMGLSFPAQAARFSGDYLLQMCASDDKGNELVPGGHVACQSYIAGIIDYHNLIRSLGTAPSVDFCLPEEVGLNELQAVVADYIFNHKKQHGAFVASPAVALALYNKYPCGKNGK